MVTIVTVVKNGVESIVSPPNQLYDLFLHQLCGFKYESSFAMRLRGVCTHTLTHTLAHNEKYKAVVHIFCLSDTHSKGV